LELGNLMHSTTSARAGPEFCLARIPAKWNHFVEKDSRQINMLEQILIAKVFNFGGICSRPPT
jgi:hypothetical protein